MRPERVNKWPNSIKHIMMMMMMIIIIIIKTILVLEYILISNLKQAT